MTLKRALAIGFAAAVGGARCSGGGGGSGGDSCASGPGFAAARLGCSDASGSSERVAPLHPSVRRLIA
jgi:hypothetical protein